MFSCLFGFLLSENAASELQNQDKAQQQHKDTQNDPRPAKAPCHKAHQQQHGRAQQNSPQVLIDQVMGGGGVEHGVDLPQEDDARAGRSGELAVQREKSLVRIAGEELPLTLFFFFLRL